MNNVPENNATPRIFRLPNLLHFCATVLLAVVILFAVLAPCLRMEAKCETAEYVLAMYGEEDGVNFSILDVIKDAIDEIKYEEDSTVALDGNFSKALTVAAANDADAGKIPAAKKRAEYILSWGFVMAIPVLCLAIFAIIALVKLIKGLVVVSSAKSYRKSGDGSMGVGAPLAFLIAVLIANFAGIYSGLAFNVAMAVIYGALIVAAIVLDVVAAKMAKKSV